jgi:Flp pilus assembly protein TadD
MERCPEQIQELRRQVEAALACADDPHEMLPTLHRLARMTPDGSEEALFANSHLAELLAERHPWRAALCARRVLAYRQDDDRAWAAFGLCHTLLGNYKTAIAAYRRAASAAPANPWYAHNLGHLLDVAVSRPSEAEPWLVRAHAESPDDAEIAASYAHALARMGRIADAKRVLAKAKKRSTSRELTSLARWLDEGAPADKDLPPSLPPRVRPIAIRRRVDVPVHEKPSSGSRRRRDRAKERGDAAKASQRPQLAVELESVLLRGLANLPLDSKQRSRARALARDAAAYFGGSSSTRPGEGPRPLREAIAVAAAVAYAIVYVDHVPLTQGEVAACFRVSVANLRGRFGELRTHLDLMPGDSRYRTQRGS